jgi:hypothetical protein
MIGHDQQMTPIDFGVKGSKVKVTWTFKVKRFSINNIRTLKPRDFKLGMMIE